MLVLSFVSCQQGSKYDLQAVQNSFDSIKTIYAPDKRVALFDLEFDLKSDLLVLSGETDQETALQILIGQLESNGWQVVDQSNLLPDSTVGKFTHAIVNNSVANIRSKPKHSAELATQAILGMELKVLKINGDFYLVQTPDGYISWVDHGGVTLLTNEEFDNWKKSPKVVYTQTSGSIYQTPNDDLKKVSDIVLGAQLQLLEEGSSHYKVQYPDKRKGYLKKNEGTRYSDWLNQVHASGPLLELYAKELLGVPYLWGGTSVKGMDCSGFTKTVYLMNGLVIPRDASQQILAGKNIDKNLDFSQLEKGDLMFFGKKATDSTRQRVTHVGIWLDNEQGEFIHASGRVKIGSINPKSSNYDPFNTNRYLGSRRYLGITDNAIINLKNEKPTPEIKS